MDFNEIIRYTQRMWKAFTPHWAPLVASGAIFYVLSIITFGIMAGFLYGGLFMMWVQLLRDGKTPEVGNLFAYSDRFLPLMLMGYAYGIMVGLGTLFLVIPGIIIFAMLLWVFPLYIEGKSEGAVDAFIQSKDIAFSEERGGGFGRHLMFASAVFVVSFGGSILGGAIPLAGLAVGIFLQTVITGALAAAYLAVVEGESGISLNKGEITPEV